MTLSRRIKSLEEASPVEASYPRLLFLSSVEPGPRGGPYPERPSGHLFRAIGISTPCELVRDRDETEEAFMERAARALDGLQARNGSEKGG